MMHATFGEAFFTLVGIGILVSLLPIFIAFWRGHPNRWIIFIITIVFGVTILGWLIALVWSLHGFHRDKATGSRGGASGLNLFVDDVRSVRVVDAGAGDAAHSVSAKQEPASPSRQMDQLDAASPRLTISEAAALLSRLHALTSRGDISGTEAESLRNGVLDRVR